MQLELKKIIFRTFQFRKWLKQERLRIQKEKNPENSREIEVNVIEGLQYLQLSAGQGYCEAQLTVSMQKHMLTYDKLAHLLINGENGIQKNADEGIKWLERATENANNGGKVTALYELGKLYFEGKEVQVKLYFGNLLIKKPDLLKSLLYFKQAAELNDPNSQYWLGESPRISLTNKVTFSIMELETNPILSSL